MRLHALESMREESPSLEIHFSSFGNNATLRSTSRPESMSHGTPRMLWISAKIALPILSNVKPRRRSCYCQVYDTRLICGGLDGVRSCVFTEGNGTVVGIARKLLGVEVEVFEGIGGPKVGGFPVGIEYLCVVLACGVYTADVRVSACLSAYCRGSAVSRDITIDDLSHSNMATIRHQIESLRLHTR